MMLQWGHAFSGVETYQDGFVTIFDPTLQWGHAFSGVETMGISPRSSG